MLTDQKLMDAIIECRRFMRAAAKARNALKNEPLVHITGNKDTGAARRASMDLTRSLARLRARDDR